MRAAKCFISVVYFPFRKDLMRQPSLEATI